MQSLFIGLGAVVASALPWLLTNVFGVASAGRGGHHPPDREALLLRRRRRLPGRRALDDRHHEGVPARRTSRPSGGMKAERSGIRATPRARSAAAIGAMPRHHEAAGPRCRSAPGSASSACGSTSRWRWPATCSARPTRPRRSTARASSGRGLCFAMYSAVCFAFSFALPARRRGASAARATHTLCLLAGGARPALGGGDPRQAPAARSPWPAWASPGPASCPCPTRSSPARCPPTAPASTWASSTSSS